MSIPRHAQLHALGAWCYVAVQILVRPCIHKSFIPIRACVWLSVLSSAQSVFFSVFFAWRCWTNSPLIMFPIDELRLFLLLRESETPSLLSFSFLSRQLVDSGVSSCVSSRASCTRFFRHRRVTHSSAHRHAPASPGAVFVFLSLCASLSVCLSVCKRTGVLLQSKEPSRLLVNHPEALARAGQDSLGHHVPKCFRGAR